MIKIRVFIYASFILLIILCGISACAEDTPEESGIAVTITNPSSAIPSPSQRQEITENQAIAIASRYVPAEVVKHAYITAGIEGTTAPEFSAHPLFWNVIYLDISITKECLGWKPDKQTDIGPKEPFTQLTVDVDAYTGEFISRTASVAQSLGGPTDVPGSSPTETTWVITCTPK